ncbi:hypothetical protein [Maridesulfovibrio sp.]|uniref:hypothetical protein n=1 Tax=Maridesulfovibrio sp. TaxID=2795000 RepID=UPI0029CA9D16|nr:hypothetical protein [Maridesulfovibrio sp.]
MSICTTHEDQYELIRTSIEKLLRYRDTEIGRKIFFKGSKTDCRSLFEDLSSLDASFEAYMDRTRSLFYIGCVGHFSSGKSSTINSILALSGTPNERITGNNPVDKELTLITNRNTPLAITPPPRNLGLNLRTYPVESDFLENYVIVDSPGTGDPALQEAMVRDFLPVCDMILYFVSATQPLNQTDLPILERLTEHLPFMPLYFVLTRTDDYRLEYEKFLDNDNINITKLDADISNIASRLADHVSNEKYSSEFIKERIIPIDNISSYNINLLRETIEDACSIGGEVNSTAHTSKIFYFSKSVNIIKNTLEKHIENKVSNYQKVFTNIEEKVDKFTEAVTLSHSKIGERWLANIDFIEEKKKNYLKSDYSSLKSELPQIMNDIKPINEHIKLLKNTINNEIIPQKTNSIINSYDSKLRIVTDNFCHELTKFCTNTRIDKLNIKDFAGSIPSNYIDPQAKELDLTLLRERSNLPFEIENMLSELSLTIKKWDTYIKTRARQKPAIMNLKQLVSNSKEWLQDDVKTFMTHVQMYQGAVISARNHSIFEDLGLTSEIDEVNRIVSVENSDKVLHEAEVKIYKNLQDKTNSYIEKYNLLNRDIFRAQILPVKFNAEDMKTQNIPAAISLEDEQSLAHIYSDWRNEFNNLADQKLNELNNQIENLNEERKTEIKKAQAKKIKRLIVYPLTTLILFSSLIYAFIQLGKLPTTFSPFVSFIINIMSSPIASFIAFIYAKKTDKTTLDINDINARYQLKISNRVQDLCRELKIVTTEIPVNISSAEELLTRKANGELSKYTDNILNTTTRNTYSKYINQVKALDEFDCQYIKITKEYIDSLTKFFADHEIHAKILSKISTKVKAEAIQPSFELLENAKKELKDVYDGIKEINIL